MLRLWKASGLAAALALSASSYAFALPPADSGVVELSPAAGAEGEDALSFDTEPDERLDATDERFGQYLSEDYKQALLQSVQQQASLYQSLLPGGAAPKGTPSWKSLGPDNAKYQTNGVTLKIADSGRVRTMLQDPGDADTVYVLTSGGGLWKTKTFSHTNPSWTPKSDALNTTSGGGLAFGRTSNVLYLGSGDPFDGFPTLGGVVTKSTDGGETWGPLVSVPGAFSINEIKVDTSGGSDILLVAADTGLYRSTNGGGSFAPVLTVAGQRFWSIARTSAGWLATSAVFGTGSPTQGRIFVSTNQGATWSPIPNAGNGFSGAGRTTLAVGRPGDAVVYAYSGTPQGTSQRDVFRSVDGGLNWTPLGVNATKAPTNPNADQPNMNIMRNQAWYDQTILVDGDDPSRNTLYIGGQLSTARSTDGGATWTLQSNWLPRDAITLPYVHADHHASTFFNVKGKKTLVWGTDGGIFISDDDGATFGFDKNNGIVSMLTQTVVSSTKNQQTVMTGLQDTGTRARLGASGFYNQILGGDGEGVGLSQSNNARTLSTVPAVICAGPGILPNTTIDYDACFQFGGGFFFTPVTTPTSVADPSGLFFLSAISSGPIFTPDGGQSWFFLARAGSNLPANFAVRGTWHTVGIDPTADLKNFAVSGTGGRLAVSTNGASTWAVRSLIGVVPGFQGFLTAPFWTKNGILYAVSESPIAGSARVLRSTDGGVTFARADSGLPDAGVYDGVADPRDPTGLTAYVGTYIGVYKTTNGGVSWTRFGAGMPTVRVTGLSITEDGSSLRAATYGRGLWEIKP